MITSRSTLPIEPNLVQKNQAKKLIVIKIGGSILADLPEGFFQDLQYLLKNDWFPIIVHGGGPAITTMLDRLGINARFVNGLRVTDEQTLEVVQMILNGKENSELVKRIQKAGGKALGLSGIDDQMILAEPLNPALGYVGKITKISFPLLKFLLAENIIPVISPLGIDQNGQVYNINADTVAEAIAIELQAKKIFLLSDIPGIYQNNQGQKKILHLLTPEDIEQLKAEQQFFGGMLPKVDACLQCLQEGIEEIYILDGREEEVISKVFAKQLIGTRILRAEVV